MIDIKIKPQEYSVGVVTYHARYEKFFQPLIERLTKTFPDKQIIVVLNGHPDKELQKNYLDKATLFLQRFPNIKYKTYDDHQSLAKCWNQLVILSPTEKILIMNDDTQVTELFRYEFEEKALVKNFSTINQSWSHFLISKDTVRELGWFEERLLGVGQEDSDYAFRTVMKKGKVEDTTCDGISNFVVLQPNPGWKNISGVVSNKYAEVNNDFIKKKWYVSDLEPEHQDWKYTLHWRGCEIKFTPKMSEPTPLYYNLEILKNNSRDADIVSTRPKKTIKVYFQKIYFSSLRILKKLYRKIL